MKIMSVLRGSPGLGHVIPAFSLCESIMNDSQEVVLCTYENGTKLLNKYEKCRKYNLEYSHGISNWVGLNVFDGIILKLDKIIRKEKPDVIIAGGEYLLPLFRDYWNIPCILLYNPEVFIESQHNQDYMDAFTYIFSMADLLFAIRNPNEIESIPTEIRKKTKWYGPILRNELLKKSEKNNDKYRIVVGNGGGLKLSNETKTYSNEQNVANKWKKENTTYIEDVVDVILEEVGKEEIEIDIYYSEEVKKYEDLKRKWEKEPIRILRYSLEYHKSLSNADMVINRAGINTINECDILGIPAILWALSNHEEQKTNIRMYRKKNSKIRELKDLNSFRMIFRELYGKENIRLERKEKRERAKESVEKYKRDIKRISEKR